MKKLAKKISLPREWERAHLELIKLLNDLSGLTGALAEASLTDIAARTSPPTTGTYPAGYFVPSMDGTEYGTAGSKYMKLGWRMDSTGTFREVRTLTGN